MTFQELISTAIENGASDLHLSVAVPPCIRVNGSIVRLDAAALMPKDIEEIVSSIIDEHHREILEKAGEVDFAYSIRALGRFRVNVFRQRGSLSMVARILNLKIPAPEELGIPEAVIGMTDKRRGLVIVTGATGSGKSTTLYTALSELNSEEVNIVTVEDPVEANVNGINQIQVVPRMSHPNWS